MVGLGESKEEVMQVMAHSGFYEFLGESHFLADDEAISYLFHRVLDPAICIYECPVRAFHECQNLPKYPYPAELALAAVTPTSAAAEVAPRDLYVSLRGGQQPRPVVLDVREPREYYRGHIPEASLYPLVQMMQSGPQLSLETPIVLVCRTGRRSRRAANQLAQAGYHNVTVLQGGMLAWENAGLLEAVDYFRFKSQ